MARHDHFGGKPNHIAVHHHCYPPAFRQAVNDFTGHKPSIRKGDTLLVRPGAGHVNENTGPGKLYDFTVMVSDESFAALIRGDIRVALDDADLAGAPLAPGG